jgi:malate permease and related proteins
MASIISIVFNSIFPVFALILIGYFLFKIKLITSEVQKGLNNLAYWVALPIFLFYKVAVAKLAANTAGSIFICMISGTLFSMGVGYLLGRFHKMPRASIAAAVQAGSRGNLAFVALPVILFTIVQAAPEREQEIIDSVILVLTPTIIIYNIICVTVMIVHSSKPSQNLKKDIFMGLITNPLIIACVLGLSWNFAGWSMPSTGALYRICNSLGQAAFPMALLGVGSQIAQMSIRGHFNWALQLSVVKTVVAPFVGFLVSRFLQMDSLQSLTVMLMLATPTAVAGYVLADQYECDPQLTASTILLSTLLSFVSFSVLLICFS